MVDSRRSRLPVVFFARPAVTVPIARPAIVLPIARPAIVLPFTSASIVLPFTSASIVLPFTSASIVLPFTRPAICLPAICLPAICLPAICLPAICLPAICLPAICLPAIGLLRALRRVDRGGRVRRQRGVVCTTATTAAATATTAALLVLAFGGFGIVRTEDRLIVVVLFVEHICCSGDQLGAHALVRCCSGVVAARCPRRRRRARRRSCNGLLSTNDQYLVVVVVIIVTRCGDERGVGCASRLRLRLGLLRLACCLGVGGDVSDVYAGSTATTTALLGLTSQRLLVPLGQCENTRLYADEGAIRCLFLHQGGEARAHRHFRALANVAEQVLVDREVGNLFVVQRAAHLAEHLDCSIRKRHS